MSRTDFLDRHHVRFYGLGSKEKPGLWEGSSPGFEGAIRRLDASKMTSEAHAIQKNFYTLSRSRDHQLQSALCNQLFGTPATSASRRCARICHHGVQRIDCGIPR